MKTTTLGRSGLAVSRIAFGTWQLGSLAAWQLGSLAAWRRLGRFDEDAAVAAIGRARELVVNFFDTAQAYGSGASERILGRALRDELVIATKGGLRQTDSGLVATRVRNGSAEGWTTVWPRWVPTTSTCTRFTGPTRPCRLPRRRAPCGT
jgi:aryl-alcohol dehydrogenase-like predicted oxidoreductase